MPLNGREVKPSVVTFATDGQSSIVGCAEGSVDILRLIGYGHTAPVLFIADVRCFDSPSHPWQLAIAPVRPARERCSRSSCARIARDSFLLRNPTAWQRSRAILDGSLPRARLLASCPCSRRPSEVRCPRAHTTGQSSRCGRPGAGLVQSRLRVGRSDAERRGSSSRPNLLQALVRSLLVAHQRSFHVRVYCTETSEGQSWRATQGVVAVRRGCIVHVCAPGLNRTALFSDT